MLFATIAVIVDSVVTMVVGFWLHNTAKKTVAHAADDVRSALNDTLPLDEILTVMNRLVDIADSGAIDQFVQLAEDSKGLRNSIQKALSIFDRKHPEIAKIRAIRDDVG